MTPTELLQIVHFRRWILTSRSLLRELTTLLMQVSISKIWIWSEIFHGILSDASAVHLWIIPTALLNNPNISKSKIQGISKSKLKVNSRCRTSQHYSNYSSYSSDHSSTNLPGDSVRCFVYYFWNKDLSNLTSRSFKTSFIRWGLFWKKCKIFSEDISKGTFWAISELFSEGERIEWNSSLKKSDNFWGNSM